MVAAMTTEQPLERYMARAIELARQAVGAVSPNPPVGAVVVRDGHIVGEGHTQPLGQAHAEIMALGDAGEALGDSLYEAKLFVRGSVKSLGADCVEKELRDEHREQLYAKLKLAGLAGEIDPSEFKRYGSARNLYHFHVDNAGAY